MKDNLIYVKTENGKMLLFSIRHAPIVAPEYVFVLWKHGCRTCNESKKQGVEEGNEIHVLEKGQII